MPADQGSIRERAGGNAQARGNHNQSGENPSADVHGYLPLESIKSLSRQSVANRDQYGSSSNQASDFVRRLNPATKASPIPTNKTADGSGTAAAAAEVT